MSATSIGVAPRCCTNSRRRCRAVTPRRSASSSTPFAIERAVADETQRPRHDARRARPRRRGRRGLGTAAKARPEPGRLRGRGGRVVADVLVFRRSRRADRPAIDAGARHGDEKLAVEPRIAGSPRAIADPAVQLHHRPSLDRIRRSRLVRNGPRQNKARIEMCSRLTVLLVLLLSFAQAPTFLSDPPHKCGDSCDEWNKPREPFKILRQHLLRRHRRPVRHPDRRRGGPHPARRRTRAVGRPDRSPTSASLDSRPRTSS